MLVQLFPAQSSRLIVSHVQYCRTVTDREEQLTDRTLRTNRQCNEMRFTDRTNRKTHFTERIPLLSIRSIRTDRHMAYTDRYGAGVLDNPQASSRQSTEVFVIFSFYCNYGFIITIVIAS